MRTSLMVFGGLLAGARAPFRGAVRLARDARLRGLLLRPLALTTALYGILLGGGAWAVPRLLEQLWARPDGEAARVLWWLLVPILFAAWVAALAVLFASIAGLIAGPFYDRIVVGLLTQEGVAAKDPPLVASIAGSAVRALLFGVPASMLGLLAFLPGVGPGFAIAGAVFSAIGLGAGALAPALLAAGLDLRARVRFGWQARGAIAGLGLVLVLSSLVPLAILLALPSAMAGGALLYAAARR
jgi:uncharacterized protein involved in cysteine biosynthesis